MQRNLLSMAFVYLFAGACGGRSEQPDEEPGKRAPEDSRPEALVVAVDGELRLAAVDGRSRALWKDETFFTALKSVDIVGQGGFLLIRAYTESAGSSFRFALLGSDGHLHWQSDAAATSLGSNAWSLSLGTDGVLSTHRGWVDSITTLSLDESSAELAGHSPIGHSVDGFLPVQRSLVADEAGEFITHYGWWKIGPSAELWAEDSYDQAAEGLLRAPVFFGSRLLHLEEVGGGVSLVSRSPTGTATIELAGATSDARIVSSDPLLLPADQRWLLVSSSETDQIWRVDLQTATSEVVPVVGPAGYQPFGYCQEPQFLTDAIRLDADGYLYGMFRNEDHAVVLATLDGRNWSPVGGTMTGAGAIQVSAHGATYFIRATELLDCLGNGLTWSAPSSAEFSGDVTQIVRRESGARIAASDLTLGGSLVYSPTGRYAASWESDVDGNAQVLRVLDIETGEQSDVAVDSTAIHSTPVWLPSD